jgi:hypothetical protein
MDCAEILNEMDETLNALIKSAELLRGVDLSDLSLLEIEAFAKTQESLAHRFEHLEEMLQGKGCSIRPLDRRSVFLQIQQKRARFLKLESEVTATLASFEPKIAVYAKRRRKALVR